MAELDSAPVPPFGPFSPTYMPFFRPHRSPLSSSNNTRQRDDYEQCSTQSPAPISPQVLVTGTGDDDDEEAALVKPEPFAESYPAWELPFASEPALEGELEQGLPPLKKLKSGMDSAEERAYCDQHSADGIVVIGAVKGILTRRDTGSGAVGLCTPPVQVSSPSGATLEPCYSWPGPLALGASSLSVHGNNSRPLSRRSSSGASSACTRASLKAVRFASGNGFMSCWGGGEASGDGVAGAGEFEGPVAAVMYLTHSADAYDRSPIVVEAGLRLPPRAKKEDEEGGGWVMCSEVEKLGRSAKAIIAKNRLAKVSVETIRPTKLELCTSPASTLEEGEPSASTADESLETNLVENSVVIREPLCISRSYRETEQEDEEEDDDASTAEAVGDDEGEEDLGMRRSGDDEDEDDGASSCNDEDAAGGAGRGGARWTFGGWSNGEVFGCCDALGGF